MEDLNVMMKKLMEEQMKNEIEKVTNDYIDTFNIGNMIDEIIADKLEDKFFIKDASLEYYIIESTKADMFKWFENNVGREDIIGCIKEALVEKMRDFSVEELFELFVKLK